MKMCIFIEKVSSLGALKISLHCLSSFAGPKKKNLVTLISQVSGWKKNLVTPIIVTLLRRLLTTTKRCILEVDSPLYCCITRK